MWGNHEQSSTFFHLFYLFITIRMHNAWLYNKNFHEDGGKNSLDVIGHTQWMDWAFHPSGTVEELVGQAVGPVSLSEQSPTFHYTEMCSSMANHLSQSYNTPMLGPFIYPMKKSWHFRKGESFHCGVNVLLNWTICRRRRRRNLPVHDFHLLTLKNRKN